MHEYLCSKKIKTSVKHWPAFTESVLNLQRTKHMITVLKLISHVFLRNVFLVIWITDQQKLSKKINFIKTK